MKISIIVAVAEGNVIGNNGKIPWHSREDLKHFRELTTDHHVLMGKKTFDSLGKPLSNRTNMVLSRDHNLKIEGTTVFQDLGDAVKFAEARNEQELFIIGGQQIYEITLPIAQKIYQTLILEKHEGDTYLPKLSEDKWIETSHEEHLDFNPPIIFRAHERR